MLYLVRHAKASVRPELPPAQWHLSPEGRADAEALAAEPRWAGLEMVYTSPEPKAAATAQRLAARHGLAIRFEPDLREVERDDWLDEGFDDATRRYLAGEAIPSWEPREIAAARITTCIDGIAARHEGDVAVVSHGTALTLYVASFGDRDGVGGYELWSRLAMPDVALVDAAARQVVQRFGEQATTAKRGKETS